MPLSILQKSDLTTEELSQLLGGRPTIDVDVIRACAVYRSSASSKLIFSATHYLCVWFWQAIYEMNELESQLFLRFVTGSSRIPLDGFEPPLTITEGEDMIRDSLPRAHTCFNQIVLPQYSSFEILKEKLVFAVKNTDSFELT